MPEGYRFPRGSRLTAKREFDQVFRDGQKVVGPAFVVYILGREEPGSKLGLAVSRKVGSAVVRNRIKRSIREFFRTQSHDFRRASALVIVARPLAAGMSGPQRHDALTQLCRRGGLLDG